MVYKDLIISTIVDRNTPGIHFGVYKDLIISTIVDNLTSQSKMFMSIKTL